MPWLAYFMFPVVLALCVLLFGFGGGGGSDGAKSASFGDLRSTLPTMARRRDTPAILCHTMPWLLIPGVA